MENLTLPRSGLDRRRKPRIFHPFHVQIRGKDNKGEAFEISTVLDNMSSVGIYVKLNREIKLGTTLNIVIRLSTANLEEMAIAKVTADTVVVRRESLPGGIWGLGLNIIKRKFV